MVMMHAVLLLALLLDPAAAAAQPPALNVRDLNQIAADLDAIVRANRGTPLADKVEDSAAKVRSAISKLRQTPPDRQGGLGDLEGAVGDLEAAVKDKLLRASAGNSLLNRMAGAARQLAVQAIAQVDRNARRSPRIAEAEQGVAAGDRERNALRYKDAVARYKDALSKAEGL
jgi:hypothetical protein